jgi:4-amino-4-deoxy-L-arabinose transferase-like glycosyltransferase
VKTRYNIISKLSKSNIPIQVIWMGIFLVLFRLIFLLGFVDLSKLPGYEYGAIAKNLVNGKGYSLFYYENNKMLFDYKPDAKPHKSAYMPPLYIFIISPVMLLKNIAIQNFLIVLLNIFLDFFSLLLLYKLVFKLFNVKTAYLSCSIFLFLPEFIYSSTRVGTTSIYFFLILLLFNLLNKEKTGILYYLKISIILVLLILIRSEILLFILILYTYFIYKRNYKLIFISILITIITILPWQIRNYYTFSQIVPMTTSSGLNFYRGNNQFYPGSWGDEIIEQKRTDLQYNENFETDMNKMYFDESFKIIKNNPQRILSQIPVKIYNLLILNPNDNRADSKFYFIPWFIILICGLFGIYFNKDKIFLHRFLYMFILYHIITAIIFFALPRYQTMMKIAILPFAASGIIIMIEKISKSRIKRIKGLLG